MLEKEIDFLYANNWFQEKYSKNLDNRYPTFKTALNLFLQNNGNNIIETGTIRMMNDWGAGCSTYIFGDFCQKYGKNLYTVDNDPRNIYLSQGFTYEFREHIKYILEDSIQFLEKFEHQIDLLYLDSLDCNPNPGANNDISQNHQLNELKAIHDRLSKDSIILLDDCIFKDGGKCKLTREFLIEKGWTLILDYYQSLWIRI